MTLCAFSAGANAQTQPAAKQAPASGSQALLDKARGLEARGHMDLAVQAWQQVLQAEPNNTEALGGLARAATLSGNEALAQTYLERLRRINPNDPNIANIGKLHANQSRPSVNAASAPRRAPSGEPGEDRSASVPGTPEAAAYRALNARRFDEAETLFKAILAKNPTNTRALAGMGYVRMQQGNFLGAISYLEQAKENSPHDKPLAAALDTARFWFILGEGQNALSSNDLTTAEKRYRAALELRPDSPEALEGLGSTLLKAQQPRAAAPLFERSVAAQPASIDGWRGLFLSQAEAGDNPGALATEQRMRAQARAKLMSDPTFLEALASAYSAVGRGADAQKVLESAVSLPLPADAQGLKTAIQLQLAGVLFASNQLGQAAGLYRQILLADSGNTAAMEGLADAEHAMGHDEQALATVETMPAASHAAAMRDPDFEVTAAAIYSAEKKLDTAQDLLQQVVTEETNVGQRPSSAIEMQLAETYIQRGNPQLAYPIYKQMVSENPNRAEAWAGLLSTLHLTGHDGDAVALLPTIPTAARAQLEMNAGYLQTMAAVYAAQGQSSEAAQFQGREQQDDAARHAVPPANVEIQNAWLLYNGMEDASLYRQLMSLGGRTDLTDAQRQTVQAIWINWALRRADQAAAVGNSPRALAILSAAAQSFPDNATVLRALASQYAQAGMPQPAVQIYKAQNMTAASAIDLRAAIGAALAADDDKDAEIWLRDALKAYASDPQILLLAAKFEQARGNTTLAIHYYQESLNAMPPPNAGARPGTGATAPISLPSAGQTEGLSLLLAPDATDLTPAAGTSHAPYVTSESGSSGHTPISPNGGAASGVVPPYMTNPVVVPGSEGNSGSESEPQGNRGATNPPSPAEPQTTASTTESPTPPASVPAGAGEEVYRPFVPYIAPPQSAAPVASTRSGTPTPVQLGNSTPPPVQPKTEKTDVLPTARYVPSTRKNPGVVSDPNMAAAQADRIRHQQEEAAAARTGQRHPPPENSVTGGALIAQPSTQPADRSSAVPDTGKQQYPQPRTQPQAVEESARARTSRAPVPGAVTTPVTPPAPPQHSASEAGAAQLVQPALAPAAPANPARSSSAVAQPFIPQSSPPTPPPSDAELGIGNPPPLHGYYGTQVPMQPTPRQQAENALAALEGSYSGWLGVTGLGHYRSGIAGIDRLYDAEAPVEASVAIGRAVRLTAVARPVFLNSGVLGTSDVPTAYVPFLGTLPANALNSTPQQFSSGVGGELQLTSRSLDVAAGYTPYEFLVHNVTGHFDWRLPGGHLSFFGNRDSVKDTQLSYAGLRDPGVSATAGPIWGGVIATTGGVRLDFGGAGGTGFYIFGDGGILTGQHVLNNTTLGGALGATFRVGNWPGHGSLILGGDVSGLHYTNNEVGLSYGQGGYFSPAWYFMAAAPATFNGEYKSNFHYTVTGAIGVQSFQQDLAPFYPLDPYLQSSFAPAGSESCIMGETLSYTCGYYPLTVTTAFGYRINAKASYRFAEHWYGGGFVFADNSNNYNAVSAGFFLRFTFRGQSSSEGRPTGLFPIRGFRPLQIP